MTKIADTNSHKNSLRVVVFRELGPVYLQPSPTDA